MIMKVKNTYRQKGKNWYSWSVSIDGSKKELSQIKYVTYTLHPTFSERRIVAKRPSTNFRKTLEGWGEFLLLAEATMKNGDVKKAELWLNLGFGNTEDMKRYNGEFE